MAQVSTLSARLRTLARRRRRIVATVPAVGAGLVLTAGLVLGTTLVNLTTAGATATINGAVYTQGQAVSVSGTGVLDPFLRVSDNSDLEQGIATDAKKVLNNDDSWTKALLLSNIPVIQKDGVNYREFILDINQLDSSPKWFLSLDEVKLFLTSTPDITSYTDGGLTGGGSINGTPYTAGSGIGHMVFSQGDNVVKLNYDLAAGSGKPDMTLLIPDSVFAGDDYCAYAQSGCNTWMGFYSRFGGWNGTDVSGTNSLFPNNDGFEEWSTVIRPVVTVAKTATATASTTCNWSIDKSVDKTQINIAQGGSATFNYTVDVSHTCDVTVNPVTGTITVTNPATLPDGTKTADATVTSVTGLFTPTGGGSTTADVVSCGTLPFTLTPGQSKVCTYTLALSAPTDGTDVATATLSDTTVAPATGSAAVTFAMTSTDTSVTVVDDKTDPAHPVTLGTVTSTDPSPTSFTYSLTKSGVAGACTDYTNTATFTTNTTKTTGSDSQKVTVCVGKDLTVSKTATPSFTRTYAWGITKAVDKTSVTVANGTDATFNYTVDVTHDNGTDSAWAAAGKITVSNPNNWEAITADITDAVDNGGTCTVVNGTGVTIPKSGSVVLDYSCSWASAPTAKGGTNTATASWDKTASSTPNGSASGTATFSFDTPTTIVDGSVTVTDDKTDPANPVTLGTASYTDTSPIEFKYSLDKPGVGGTCTDYTNTATFKTNTTGTTDSAQQTVEVCAGIDLTVSKTATGGFNRTYLWKIEKAVDQTSVTVASGDSATFHYTVTVTQTGFTDSGYFVNGKITIANPNDFEDVTLTGLTDAVDNGGACTVDAGPYVIPMAGSLDVGYTCSYASAPSSYSGTNTATATWDKDAAHTPTGSASGSANFTLAQGGATNKTIHVTDTYEGDLGTATATDSAPFTVATFTYDRTEKGVGGTCTKYDNTATITETKQSASQEVTVCAGLDLTVTKTAAGTFDRAYLWKIAKDVDKTSVTIAAGDSATFHYTVTATQTGVSDSGWQLAGKITIANPNDFEAITLTDLGDVVDNGGACTVDAGPYTVPASGSIDVGYTCSYASAPSSYSGKNTATATWDKDAAHTPTSTASGSANFTLAQAGSTNKTIHVTDTFAGDLGTVTATDAAPFAVGVFTYDRTEKGVGGTCTKYDNTATITETKQSASQEVTVCAGLDLTVSKTAAPYYQTKYAWQITKAVDKTTATVSNGDSATFNYTVSVSHDSGTDSGWQVTGTITVVNPNDFESIVADVSDAVDNGGSCTVAGGSNVTVAAGDSVSLDYTCTYSSAPTSATGTNTATATWDAAAAHTPDGSATGSKSFDFASPDKVVDECVSVDDSYAGHLGTVCVGDANPTAFTYSRTVTPTDYGQVCGTTTYDNTATFTTNDTGATGSASKTVSVTVINCGVPGKTPGFWGNKNGHAILDTNGDGFLDTSVSIGSGSHVFTVTTIAQSDKILRNSDCASGSPAIFDCSTLLKKINVNSFEELGAQTLALTYNINNINKFSGQSLASLGITTSIPSLGITPSTTVNQVLVIANTVIGNSFTGGSATQAQIGALNTLLGLINRESL